MLVGQRFAGEGIRGVRGGTSALMEAQTLQFENARVLASLHANDLKLLKAAGRRVGSETHSARWMVAGRG
jgi:hypothetical protein